MESLLPVMYCTVVEDDDGVSKGYGFVRFMEERERDLSLVEMAGAVGLGRKALTIKPALAPKSKCVCLYMWCSISDITAAMFLSEHQ